MAEEGSEVGVAFVSLIPSARGFFKASQREVAKEFRGRSLTVPVTPEFDRRAILAGMLAEGTRIKVPADVQIDRRQVTTAFMATTRREHLQVTADVDATALIGDTRRAIRATEATRPTIDIGVDVDRPSLRRLTQRIDVDAGRPLGERVGVGLLAGLSDTLRSGASTGGGSLLSNPLVSTVGVALGVAAAASIGASLVASLVTATAGLGVIGLGALIAKEHPAVRAAATDLMATLKEVFTVAVQPMIRPFSEALDVLGTGARELGPQFRDMFAAIAPAIVPLTQGLVGFVREALPGFTALLRVAEPLLSDLSTSLPLLGQYVGDFFGIIAGAGPETNRFFRDLILLLGGTIKALGIGIVVWAKIHGGARTAIVGMVNLARNLPGQIRRAVGGLGSLLYQAGRNVIGGLIDGIRSRIPSLGSIASSVASTIRNYLPFSPAKVGPLSGAGAPFRSGQAIARDLAAGMSAGTPAVRSAGDQLAGAVGGGAARSGSAMAAGVRIELVDNGQGGHLMDFLRESIGVTYGGDPVAALGH